MKKLYMLFILISVVLSGVCSKQVSDVNENAFKNGKLESVDKNTTIQSITFEEDKVVVSLDIKKIVRLETVSKYLSSRYDLY
ncbi:MULTISPECIES: hypothetical protein [unclassified Granulicatella]|uniref:hypothetical protein n=1 Tax=unclassified Granulicatella TaxID=2630493 RepID=UPI001074484E|nr:MULTISPECIES: hypothetical protein [unclassified Granulicatella]MBF0779860.1 hypothetical protein [Granulicatella sp. 19428wC4_WM01]TFU96064.1 hypothetical protein E4T68_02010 [Granulicatella sp. WM01]